MSTGSILRSRAASRTLLVAVVLIGAFASTSAITGWVYLKDGPIAASLGKVDGGEGSHSLLMEASGVQLDISVPLIDWWGEAEIAARAAGAGEIFLGAAPVDVAREYLKGTSYAAVRPAGDATWKVFPVPGQGPPPDPLGRDWNMSSHGRSASIPIPDSDNAIVLVRLDGQSPVAASMSVQFSAPHARVYALVFALLAAACFGVALFLVIRDPLRPRRKAR